MLQQDSERRTFAHHGGGAVLRQELVANLQRETVLQVEEARLAAVFDLAAALTDFRFLVPRFGSGLPSEDAKRTRANFAFGTKSILRHSDVRVIAQAHLQLVKQC
jgi:hypothetical protein